MEVENPAFKNQILQLDLHFLFLENPANPALAKPLQHLLK
jgi:hypothetical protein